jgi:hypothetical protein
LKTLRKYFIQFQKQSLSCLCKKFETLTFGGFMAKKAAKKKVAKKVAKKKVAKKKVAKK